MKSLKARWLLIVIFARDVQECHVLFVQVQDGDGRVRGFDGPRIEIPDAVKFFVTALMSMTMNNEIGSGIP